PETTITDDFNRADGTTIGNQLTWTEVAGTWDTVSNQVQMTGPASDSATYSARAESDLSSADHYAQLVYVNAGTVTTQAHLGPAARFSPSAQTHYLSVPYNGTFYLEK